jgi:cupin 2 domain-containing protein
VPLGNLFAALPATPEREAFETLLEHRGAKIERIVSTGQASAPGFWYDEPRAEWVAVLAGRARLRFADEPEARELGPGDFVMIDAHRRHRVDWTDPAAATVWLAVHLDA